MRSSQYLQFEVALLLAKYGKSSVLRELARKMDCSVSELEGLLSDNTRKIEAPGRPRKTTETGVIDDMIAEHPDKVGELTLLMSRFDNRTFLPELRDVRRFFDRRGETLGATKARVDAKRKLLKLLCDLDRDELMSLASTGDASGYSSLGIISAEILKR